MGITFSCPSVRTNHIFSERLLSGDDNDRDEDLQKNIYKDKDTQTQKKTDTKCFQDLMYAIFIKAGSSRIKNVILAVFL